MTSPDPFHDGERYVQERSGEQASALRNARVVSDEIPPRAIPFLAQQRMLAVGSVDDQGTVSASILFGTPGFSSSPDGRSVVIERALLHSRHSRLPALLRDDTIRRAPALLRDDIDSEDPVWRNLRVGADVGLLAIELESRRRLRVNGVVSALDARRVGVIVREAYPNCPKYIQRRQVHQHGGTSAAGSPPPASGVSLDEVRSGLVERADTLFVASRHPTRGVDVSHRGGEPGFVRILDPGCLRIPDYRGNSMFNTLGNFVVDDRAGLVFLDFDRGAILQMTGTVAVRFDVAEDPRQPTGGSGRYWDFRVAHWLERPVATHLVWELLDYSPHNPIVSK